MSTSTPERHARDGLSVPGGWPGPFDPALAADLPAPARRWLTHAIAPGTPLFGGVRLEMHGRIRIGSWWPFTATQVLRPASGFVWAARARVAHLPVTGFDRYAAGEGEMRWRLLGTVPVMSGGGPDITRSAAGRLAGELMLVPGAALSPFVTWEPLDDEHAVARVTVGAWTHRVTIGVAPSGALTSVRMPRWGNPDRGGAFREHEFGAVVHREASSGGFTIPSIVSAGWWPCTERWGEGEFIRFVVDGFAHF
ncbi:DUF6544 family protein [Spirillospora albida]|uniref:DUF6544 family protein n=1 Tax=Spirillospora albida TaxID=58123 RepID=UPI000689F59C|nr:DUF6544 family protein [Spirillospora albida]